MIRILRKELLHQIGAVGCVLVALVLTSSGIAGAHLPVGKVFPAYGFPQGAFPVVDGDLSDWAEFDEAFAIGTEQLVDLVAEADVNEQDFSVRLWVGWSDTENRLYIAARVLDDIHQIDRPAGSAERIFQDDDMEIFVDADHSGGQFADFSDLPAVEQLRRNGTEASHFVIAGPPPDEDFFVGFSAADWYSQHDGPFTAAAYRFQADVDGLTAINYEMMLVPYNRIDVGAEFQSIQHDLVPREVLGFNVRFNDFDQQSTLLDAAWSLSGGQNDFRLSERFSDLRLMEPDPGSTAVRDRSWGRIKASFAGD
jgi:hypothetical protein